MIKNDYDLVIIGGTKQGFFCAEYAVKLGARVALVMDNLDFIENYEDFLLLSNKINYQEFLQEKKRIINNKILPELEKLGVDIIISKCQLLPQKQLILSTKNRLIKSVSYLLAMTSQQLFGLPKKANKNSNILTIDEFFSLENCNNFSEELAIFGNDINAIYLVNKLCRDNQKISLISPSSQVLASEDEDISYQLQLFLESKGVKIYLNSNETNCGINDNLITLRATNLTKDRSKEDDIGLSNLGIKNHQGKIEVNSKLQTKHPQIYGCGDLLGGYGLESLTLYEGKIAVNNALFFACREINYSEIAYTLKTNPSINRLGYTEKQAKFLLSEKIKVLKIFCLLKSPINWQQNVIFIKIIIDKYNYIIGFHSFGDGVEELITAITFIKKQNLSLSYLFKMNFTNVHTHKLITEIEKCWQKENQRQYEIILDLAETFFIWKRS